MQEAARAFTGWGLKRQCVPSYNPADHDDAAQERCSGQGRSARWLRRAACCAEHPSTTQRLVTRLFTFFAYDDPEPKVLAPLVAVFHDTHGSIRETLRALFLSRPRSRPRKPGAPE